MTPRRTLAALGLTALATVAFVATRAPAKAETDVGVFTAIVAGSHVGSENPIPLGGLVPGAALEVVQHAGRVALGFEGIPTVGAQAGTSGPYGRSSASLSLLNATATVDLDPRRRFRAGAGFQLINLANRNGRNGDRNTVRITSPIYTAGTTVPLRRGGIDIDLNVDPNLRGVLHIFPIDGTTPEKPETGAEIDYRAAYRWTRGDLTYRAGLRGLSYHTRDTQTGELVDRNVGGGVTFDVRLALGSR